MDNERLRQASTHADETEDVIDLAELIINFLRIGKRVWWLFPLAVAVGIVSMCVIQFTGYTPVYRSEVTFTVATDSGSSYSVGTTDQLYLTFPYILDSAYFRGVLLDALGQETLNGTITAQAISGSNMVTMQVDSPSAEDAKRILEAALEVYPSVSRFVLGDIEFRLLDEISTPTEPYNQPQWRQILLYGGAGGLLAACMLVGLMALFSKTAKTTQDMDNWFSMECLGVLPEVQQKARKTKGASVRISVLNERTPHGFRESVQALDLRIRSALGKDKSKILLVTSTTANEGKSTVAINLAEQMAKDGFRVLLVDFDLLKQKDAQLLNCPTGQSVETVLRTQAEDAGFIQCLKSGVYFWGGTKPSQHSIAVLKNQQLKHIMQVLGEQLDYIICDTSPCGMVQDAATLADLADGILFVVGYDCVTKAEISQALSMLESRRARVMGYVINRFPQSGSGSYGYGYGKYGYGRYGYGGYASHYDTKN